MKGILLLIITTILFATLANAAIEATYSCADKRCLEGTPINYTISIYNNLNDSIQINYLLIGDADTQQIISTYRLEKELKPSELYTFTYEDKVVVPKEGYTFQYAPCIDVSLLSEDKSIKEKGVVCDKVTRSLTVLPLSKIGCEADWQCASNQFCDNFYKCKELKCENYTFPLMRKCLSYNALWAVIGLVIIIALGVLVYFRSKYKVIKKLKTKK